MFGWIFKHFRKQKPTPVTTPEPKAEALETETTAGMRKVILLRASKRFPKKPTTTISAKEYFRANNAPQPETKVGGLDPKIEPDNNVN